MIIKYKKYDYWRCIIFFDKYVFRWGFGIMQCGGMTKK